MGWKKELENMTLCDKTHMKKRYIKEEFTRYYYYMDQYLEEKVKLSMMKIKYADYLDNPVNTTSFIKVGDKPTEYHHKVILYEGKIQVVQKNIEKLEERLNELDTWFGWMNEVQRNVIKVYVCKYRCSHINEAIEELNYSKSSILDVVDKTIDLIYRKTQDEQAKNA